ncbi:hypothetical protein PIB30_014768 [Stylosanthes scabra]|uniref:Plastocyanin-like domain-containing protein n=1 Tax=Stylosanthes scabra TaxID=79078 RepID=A0ABU6Y5M8_9FABA|nr:hypothetical protein [Stylosanthes scabra]
MINRFQKTYVILTVTASLLLEEFKGAKGYYHHHPRGSNLCCCLLFRPLGYQGKQGVLHFLGVHFKECYEALVIAKFLSLMYSYLNISISRNIVPDEIKGREIHHSFPMTLFQFPGPRLDLVTNDNLVLILINKLDEPFLVTWNDIKQRKNSWQDGVLGTKCTISPNSNYTYKFQTKDEIGSFSYFPSTAFVKLVNSFSVTFALKIAVLGLG